MRLRSSSGGFGTSVMGMATCTPNRIGSPVGSWPKRDIVDDERLDIGPVGEVAVLVHLDQAVLLQPHADGDGQAHAGRERIAAARAAVFVLAGMVHVDERDRLGLRDGVPQPAH